MKHKFLLLGVAVMAASISGVQAAAQGTTFETWAAAASAANASPITPVSGDASTSWTAPDGRTVSVVVQAPHPSPTAPTVQLGAYTPGNDATPVFKAAIQAVINQGAGKLNIPKATYTFMSLGTLGQGQFEISGLTDVTIQGNGSTFVFTKQLAHTAPTPEVPAVGIYMQQDLRVELTNFTIAYSLPHQMGYLATMSSSAPYTLVPNAGYTVTASDAQLGHMAEYNATTQNYVKRGYLPGTSFGSTYYPTTQYPVVLTYNGTNGFTYSGFSSNMAGRTYVVFEDADAGSAIQLEDSPQNGSNQLQDITLDQITINSAPGMAITVYGLKRGVNIQHSAILPASGGLISSEYDGIHVTLAGGDVLIQHNQIDAQGDDGINLASPQLLVLSTSGTNLTLAAFSRFIQDQDVLTFFDNTNHYLGYATVEGTPTGSGGNYSMVLSNTVSGLTTSSRVRDMNMIGGRMAVLNNTIANCECHGIIAQEPNMLLQGNTISNTMFNGIRLMTNVGYFQEGTGAINSLVNDNLLSETGIDVDFGNYASTPYTPYGAISLYGISGTGVPAVITQPSNINVNVTNNTIVDSYQDCVVVASSESVNVTGNSCQYQNATIPNLPSIYVEDANTVSIESNTSKGTVGPITIGSNTSNITSQQSY